MSTGPLKGVSVIELGGIGPGPFAGMLLADLGADVVRIDRPTGAELFPGDPKLDVLNRGKRSVILDLKKPEALEALLAMVERVDVLLEGYRPGVAERLGIGPDDCAKRNAALVYGRMTGWGQEGPLAQTAGHDINYIAVTGALHAIGSAGGPPQIPVNFLGDFGGGGTYLVIGVLAALQEAARSGCGQVVDAAISDGAAHLLAAIHGVLATGTWQDERGVNILDGERLSTAYMPQQTTDMLPLAHWKTGSFRLLWRGSASTSTLVNRTTARHGHACVRSSRPRSRNILRLTGRKCSGAPTPASLPSRA